MTSTDGPELIVRDAAAWRNWLDRHHEDQAAVWLVLAKKGTTNATSLSYDKALHEALCYGWIDGQTQRRDDRTYVQRFTPRRPRSRWSKRNVANVERLAADGRMHEAGLREVERAKTDGRWDAAYAVGGDVEVPADFAEALTAAPVADARFRALTKQNRNAILYYIATAKRPETRQRRIEQFVAMLLRGQTLHPQKRDLESVGPSLEE